MKKTFNLTHEKKAYPRMADLTKNEIRKYIKRERKKTLPTGMDYWDFDCKFGATEAEAVVIHLSEIDKNLNEAIEAKLTSFYVEILAEAKARIKPEPEAPAKPKIGWKSIEVKEEEERDS